MTQKKVSLENLLSVFQKEKTFKKEKEKISVYIYEGYKISVELNNQEEIKNYDSDEKNEESKNISFSSNTTGNIILSFLDITEKLKENNVSFSDLKKSEINVLKVTYIIYKNKKIYLETEEMYKGKEDENTKIVNTALSDLSKIGNSYDEILYKLYKYVVDKKLK